MKLRSINDYLQEKELSTINVATGVHSGEVIIGKVGLTDVKEILVIGNDVRATELIEELSPLYDFNPLFSEKTQTLLGQDYPLKEVDQLSIPGYKQKMRVYEWRLT
jgi:adenylate cyclase